MADRSCMADRRTQKDPTYQSRTVFLVWGLTIDMVASRLLQPALTLAGKAGLT